MIKKKSSTKKKTPYVLPEGKVLVLRVCPKNMISFNGFRWKKSGIVIADDWSNYPSCGGGLHGWLWGVGDYSATDYADEKDANWMVLEVEKNSIVELNRKVKFESCNVIYCGQKYNAIQLIKKFAPLNSRINYDTIIVKQFATDNQQTILTGSHSKVTSKSPVICIAEDFCNINVLDECIIETDYNCNINCTHNNIIKSSHETRIKAINNNNITCNDDCEIIAHDDNIIEVEQGCKVNCGKDCIVKIRCCNEPVIVTAKNGTTIILPDKNIHRVYSTKESLSIYYNQSFNRIEVARLSR